MTAWPEGCRVGDDRFRCVGCQGLFYLGDALQAIDGDGRPLVPLCPGCFREVHGDGRAAPRGDARRLLAPTWLGVDLARYQLAVGADEYIRAVETVRVLDGDTALLRVDLGFYTWSRQSCRLAGLNCNELAEAGGPDARDELTRLLGLGAVSVRSVHPDKFAGRFDALVTVATGPAGRTVVDVNRALVHDGYAVPWDGRGTKPHVPWPRVA